MNESQHISPFLEPTMNKYLLVSRILGENSAKAQRLMAISIELVFLYFDS
ncbi:hypothetical protein [Metabacillus sp. B2-18]|nr:hypothetical protein [Metabacillus sp. B2-18]UGB28721.1 hypothetical protein LPC09_13015 [Metabacillus sp. B2-18]